MKKINCNANYYDQITNRMIDKAIKILRKRNTRFLSTSSWNIRSSYSFKKKYKSMMLLL